MKKSQLRHSKIGSAFPKAVSILLALMMILSILPSTVFASEVAGTDGNVEIVSEAIPVSVPEAPAEQPADPPAEQQAEQVVDPAPQPPAEEPIQSEVVQLYKVRLEHPEHASIALTDEYGVDLIDEFGNKRVEIPEGYTEGTKVYFAVKPQEGYALSEIKVTDAIGTKVEVKHTNDVYQTAYIEMPAYDVTIDAVLVEVPVVPEIVEEPAPVLPEDGTEEEHDDAIPENIPEATDGENNAPEIAEGGQEEISDDGNNDGDISNQSSDDSEIANPDEAPSEEQEEDADETPIEENRFEGMDREAVEAYVAVLSAEDLTELGQSLNETEKAYLMEQFDNDAQALNELFTPAPEVEYRTLAIRLQNEGGSVNITAGEDSYALTMENGEVKIEGNADEYTSFDGYGIVLARPEGETVKVSVQADDAHVVNTFIVSNEETSSSAELVDADTYEEDIVLDAEDTQVMIGFADKNLYFISDDFDYSQYNDLDMSSMRLIVATSNPEVFVDDSVIISELNGLYLLQFEDTATAIRAYAYYERNADMVEVDGKIMAINDEAFVGGNNDTMTENENPFTEATEAIEQTGVKSYDVAVIDTGANNYADEYVSVIGDFTGDDNGHGTRMAQLVKEQNPDAKILSIKAFESNGLADLSAIYAAFQYAMTQKVKIINISASAISLDSATLYESVKAALDAGIIVVASAGNNGANAKWFVPAGFDGVTTIGACDKFGERLESSNFGDCINYNVVAPSTSEAAAKFSGWLSANDISTIDTVLNKGLIFENNYVEDEGDYPDYVREFKALLRGEPTAEEVETYVLNLSKAQALVVLTSLTEAELNTVLELLGNDRAANAFRVTGMLQVNSNYSPGQDYGIATTGIYGPYNPYKIQVSWPYTMTQSNTFVSYCTQPAMGGPGEGADCYFVKYTSRTRQGAQTQNEVNAINLAIKVWLVGPQGPYYERYKQDIFRTRLKVLRDTYPAASNSAAMAQEYCDYSLTHYMISGAISSNGMPSSQGGTIPEDWGDIDGVLSHYWTRADAQYLRDTVAYINQLIPDSDPCFQGAEAYYGYTTRDGSLFIQDQFWVESVPPAPPEPTNGTLKVKKVSADPSATSGSGYSLAGAVYGVYTNSACTDASKVATLTTDGNGVTETITLEAATYYVKETKASPGFSLDTHVYTAEVKTNTEKQVDSVEPINSGKIKLNKSINTSGLSQAAIDVMKASSAYTVAGAEYTIYKDSGCTQKYGSQVLTVTASDGTGMSGSSNEISGVPIGTYYVKETKASPGTSLNSTVYTVSITASNYQTVQVVSAVNNPVLGSAKVEKTLSTSGLPAYAVEIISQGGYSVNGAKYAIYKDQAATQQYGTEVFTITASGAGLSGVSQVINNIPMGTYYIKETQAPTNLEKDNNAYPITITAANVSQTQVARSTELPTLGSVELTKSSAVPNITNGNSCYSLQNAKYGVYKDRSCNTLVIEKQTDENGKFKVDNLPMGVYYIKELSPSKGYGLAECNTRGNVHTVTLTSSQKDASVACQEPADGDPLQVLVQKVDEETGKPIPQGAATMKGGEYTVKYYTNYDCSEPATRTWVFVTNSNGIANLDENFLKSGSDPLYLSAAGNAVIPRGSYTLQETKAPAGYRLDPNIYSFKVNGTEIAGASGGGIHAIGTTPTQDINKGTTSPEPAPVRGGIKVQKLITDTGDNKDGDVDVSNVNFAIVLAPGKEQKSVIVPKGGTAYEAGQVVSIITTNSEGIATTGNNDLPYGYYDVYELSKDSTVRVGDTWTSQEAVTPGKLANNTGVLYNALHTQIFVEEENKLEQWNITNDVVYSLVEITKNDADRGNNTTQGDASLAGIRYAIVNRSQNKVSYPAGTTGQTIPVGAVVDIVTTNENGQITSQELPYGQYDVIELRLDATIAQGDAWQETGSSIYANTKGYLYTPKTVSVKADTYNKTYPASYTNPIVKGGVKIQKVLEELNAAEIEGLSNLANVTFSVVNASDKDVCVGGHWYAAIPDKGPNGSDTENSASDTNGGYTRETLLQAVADNDVIVATMTTDAQGKAQIDGTVLPYGTYYVYEETTNPTMLINNWILRIEVREEGVIIDAEGMPSKDPIVRGDLNFTKVDIDGNFRGNTPFLLVAYDKNGNEVEAHVVVTNANGVINTKDRDNTYHTNGMDDFVTYNEATKEYTITDAGESLLSTGEAASYGIWFSQGINPLTGERSTKQADAVADRGAMYYGNYRLFEIKCRENADKQEELLKSPVLSIGSGPTAKDTVKDEYGHIISETSDKTLNFRHFVDLEITLTSEARDVKTDTQVTFVRPDNVLSDKVSYTHLKASAVYKWVVDFVEKDNTSNVLAEVTVDGYMPKLSSTNVETAEGSFTVQTDCIFSGDVKAGTRPTVTSTGNVDTTALEGKEVAAIVYLYEYIDGYDFTSGTGVDACDFLSSHNVDADDINETIFVPGMKTYASNILTGDRVGAKSTEDGIKDQVVMTNLGPKERYMLIGSLVDKKTGEMIPSTLTSSTTFYSGRSTPRVETHTEELPAIMLDSSEYDNDTIVTYVEMWRIGNNDEKLDAYPVITHELIDDEDESVHYTETDPEVEDKSTEDHVGRIDENDEIQEDKVIKNLIPGMEYKVVGKLFYRDDCVDANGVAHTAGEEIPLKDYKVSVAGRTAIDGKFTATAETMTVVVSYKIDSSAMEGLSIVSFNWLYHNDILIDKDDDPTDEHVTIHFPKVRTILKDGTDNSEDDAYANTEMTFIDTVTCENLIPGLTYKLNATLMDKKTGEEALDDAGNEITGTTTFTATKAKQSVDVTMTFSGKKLAGKDVVAYETLIHHADPAMMAQNKADVARHKDINDEAQTLHLPKITSKLSDSVDLDEDAFASDHVRLINPIKYENVLPGQTYTIIARLYDQETGEPARDDSGKPIVTRVTFTPEDKEGTIDTFFEFSGKNLAGHTVFSLEEMFRGDKIVAAHDAVDQGDRPVHLPKIVSKLMDSIDDDMDAFATDDVNLKNVIRYYNLLPGREYTLKTKLYDYDTKAPALDDEGNEIIATYYFTPDSPDGEINLAPEQGQDVPWFGFSGKNLAGHTVFALEELFRDNKKVAEHAAVDQGDQPVYFPKANTSLVDSVDGEHDAAPNEESKLVDTVEMVNIIRGYTYQIKGWLMDKTTGTKVEGSDTTATLTTDNAPGDAINTTASVDMEYTVDLKDMEGKDVVAYVEVRREHGNGVKDIAEHKDIESVSQTLNVPELSATSLKDSIDGEPDALAGEGTKLIDTVTYKNLLPGREYTLVGELHMRDTGEIAVDNSGNEIVVQSKFTPSEEDGVTQVVYQFDGTNLAGEDVVAFEHLYRDTKALVSHADIEDAEQKLDFPLVLTTLEDTIDYNKDALAGENVLLVDMAEYQNLIPGREYTMQGILMDKETGEPALDDEGNIIQGVSTFTAEDTDGNINVEFSFSGVNLAGHTVVAYEVLIRDGKAVGAHCNIESLEQMLYIPRIETSLGDSIDGGKDAFATEDMTLVDTVSYFNLIRDFDYHVEGILYNQDTNEPAVDDEGNIITAEADFTAEDVDGDVDVTFHFSGKTMAGQTVVAFQNLYRKALVEGDVDKRVAMHEDITDESQIVWIPKITSKLVDSVDYDEDAHASDDVTLIDIINYENLLPGEEYTLEIVLYDEETGEPAIDDNGDVIKTEITFTPEEPDGQIEVPINFPGKDLAGHTVYALEELIHNDKPVAEHDKVDQGDQPVHLPKIVSKLMDSIDLDKDAFATDHVKLVNPITYTNLLPGREYTIYAKLYDETTGKPALDDEGNEIITSVTFTPEEPDGVIDTIFEFSGKNLAGHTVFSLEELYRGDKLVAEHSAVDQGDQPVCFPLVLTILHDKIDGEHDALAGEITLVDTVIGENLIPEYKYSVSGVLMNRATGEPLKDAQGKEIVATGEFTAKEDKTGTVDLEYSLDATGLEGNDIVAFVDLTRKTNSEEQADKKVGEHKDLENKDQTVNLPKLTTELVGTASKLHNEFLSPKVSMTDIVTYSNLQAGAKYIIAGVLVSKADGKEILNKDGKPVYAETEFVAEEANGTVELVFSLDNIPDVGITAVAFDTLARYPMEGQTGEAKVVALHNDIADDSQTGYIPAMRTTLTTTNGLKTINGYDVMTLYDAVRYKNLKPGVTYTVVGTLMDKETGKPVVDDNGKEVVSNAQFTAEESSGTVTVGYQFDAPQYIGKQIVAFEALYEGDVLVAEHKNINDADQTVSVLTIRTLAHTKDGGKTFDASGNQIIIDTVMHENLEKGHKYILHTTLVDQKTGKPIQSGGKDIAGNTNFIAGDASGKIDIELKIPANTFTGAAVIFEQLMDAETGNIICIHEDIDDEDQTVYFAKVTTEAAFKDGSKKAVLTTDQVVIDKASFEGLQPGVEYVITSTLVNKSTGKVVTSLGKPVTTTKTFKADNGSGTILMELTVPLRTVNGDTVVFEVIKEKATDTVACSHQDINDAKQTVNFYNVPQPTPTPTPTPGPRTGDDSNTTMWLIIGGVAILALVGAGIVIYRRKRSKHE